MIPILFDASITEFTTNGLGGLTDAISCEVTEERNGKYELEMEYSVDGIHYSDIALSRIIYAKPADGKSPQAFRIYKISKPLRGIVTVYAEHLSYQMNHIPVMPFTASNCPEAFVAMKANAAENCPFDFWTDKSSATSAISLDVPRAMRSVLGGEANSFLSQYGGEYEWDNWTAKLWVNRGSNNGVVIRYGKNLTDLTQEENIQNTYTGICPYWVGQDAEGQETVVTLDENVLHSANAENFPYQRTLTVNMTSYFETMPTQEELREEGEAYILRNNIGIPKVNLKFSFVALWQTNEYQNTASIERVNLCDTVTVIFEKLGVSAQAKVIKTVYDSLLERYISLEIGDAKSNFADTMVAQETTIEEVTSQNTQSIVSNYVSSATSKITGGLGGHVVINYNADGYPNEILIMDTDNKETAVNVIRMNEAGIGFSQNGYNGTFNSAWLIDGTLDMAQINVINLVANMIQGGTLALGGEAFGNGEIIIYNSTNEAIGQLNTNGLRMNYGANGSYVLMNAQVGFAGYDKYDQPLYWVNEDEFHMKKSVVEEEITLCNKMRFIPITTYDGNNNIVNDGIGLVSVEG